MISKISLHIKRLAVLSVCILTVAVLLSGCDFSLGSLFGKESESNSELPPEPIPEESESVSVTEPVPTEPPTASEDKTEETVEPTEAPTDELTDVPTEAPTEAPTESPTDEPTETESESQTEPSESTEPPTTETPEPPVEPSIVDTSKLKYTYDEMVKDLIELKEAYPTLFNYRSIGTTADGRSIYVAILGSGTAKKQIVAEAGTHGREYLNPMSVMATLEYYLKNYESGTYDGKKIKDILSDTDLYVIPMLNPDGITLCQLGINGLNKPEIREGVKKIYEDQKAAGNTKMSLETYIYYWKANALGVDINRNFDTTSAGFTGADPEIDSPRSSGYAGTHPGSEAETQAYMALVESLSNPVACISLHSQGEVIYWNCRQDSAGKAEAKKLAEAMKALTGFTMINTDSFTAASADWCMLVKGIPSVTLECGTGMCPLPYEQLERIYTACRDVFLCAALMY